MTKIELLKGWNGNTAGTVLNLEMDGVAQLLIERGLARKVEDKPVKLQTWVKKARKPSNSTT